jgi:hypothetical protein
MADCDGRRAGKVGYRARVAMHKFIKGLLEALGPAGAMQHAGLVFSKSMYHLRRARRACGGLLRVCRPCMRLPVHAAARLHSWAVCPGPPPKQRPGRRFEEQGTAKEAPLHVLTQLLEQQQQLQQELEQQGPAAPSQPHGQAPFGGGGAAGATDPVSAAHEVQALYERLAARKGAGDGVKGALLEALALLLQLYPASFEGGGRFSRGWLMGACHQVLRAQEGAARDAHTAGASPGACAWGAASMAAGGSSRCCPQRKVVSIAQRSAAVVPFCSCLPPRWALLAPAGACWRLPHAPPTPGPAPGRRCTLRPGCGAGADRRPVGGAGAAADGLPLCAGRHQRGGLHAAAVGQVRRGQRAQLVGVGAGREGQRTSGRHALALAGPQWPGHRQLAGGGAG